MLDTTSLRKRLLTSARRRPAALSGRLEELEDRSVPAAVVTVPYQQNNLALPHPGFEGATTTLKAVVRDGVHGYRVTWDTNLDGNFANDTSADYNVGQLRDVGRTFTVPAGTANSVISVGVRAVDLVTSEVLTGTYRIQVSAITPQFGPRPVPQPGTYPEYWTAAERELVRDVTTDEALWYLHRQLITSGQGTNTIVGSVSPSGSLDAPTPLALELFARTGHLPAYPPGTMNAYGGNQPAGNDARWASDPYAETALRLANYLANQLTVFGIDPSAEQNDGRTPIAGTDDGRAYFTPLGTSFGDAGEVGFQSQTLSAFAAVLPVFGGTAVQVGAGVGHTWEYLAQQMVDGLSFAQAKSGTGNGGWYYNPNPYVGAANLESTGDAVRALAAAESGGGGFGVIVNNDTKYRVPNILYSARQANGSVPRFFPTTGGSFTYTASALLGYRWIGAQNFSPTDTTTLAPYSSYTRGQLRTAYDQALRYVGDGWFSSAPDPTYGWVDHFWDYPDARFDGVPTTTVPTGANGNAFAMFLHAAAYRTGEPDLSSVPTTAGGPQDWARDFESYLSTSQRRYAPDYGTFGSVSERWVEYPSLSAMYFGPAGRTALAGLTLAPDPGPVAAASASPLTAYVGDPVAFDGSASWHVLPNRTIVSYEWDFDAANGVFPGAADATGVAVTHAFTRPGTFTVTLRVRDDATASLSDTVAVAVTVLNRPPVARAGGPYAAALGSAVLLDGTASFDPDAAGGDRVIGYQWDLDADGSYDDAFGATVALAPGTYGLGAHPIGLMVTDTFGATGTEATTVTMLDVTPPTVTGTTPSLAGGILPAGTTSLAVTFSEAVTGAGTPVGAGLAAWWSGDGTAADAAGASNGTLIDGASYVPGRVGQAFAFDGLNDAVDVGSTSVMNSIPLTVDAWVRPALRTDGTYFPNNVVSNDEPFLAGHGFGVNVFPGGAQLSVLYQHGLRTVAVPFVADAWYHVAVVYTTGNYKAYVNGVLVDDYSFAQAAMDGATVVRIGKVSDDAGTWGTRRFFKGLIDEVGVYSTALSGADVAALHAAGSAGQPRASAANYELRSAGADGLLGTADDPLTPLTAVYAGGTAKLTTAPLAAGVYRLTVADGVADAAGNALDGDGTGAAGGDWVRDFVVGASRRLTGPGGTAFDVALGGPGAGQLAQTTGNAADGLNRLVVGGTDFAPTPSLSAPTFVEAHAPTGYTGLVADDTWRAVPGLALSLTTTGANTPARLSALLEAYQDPAGGSVARFLVDGVPADPVTDGQPFSTGGWGYDLPRHNRWATTHLEEWVTLPAGVHTITVQVRATGPAPTIWGSSNVNAAAFPDVAGVGPTVRFTEAHAPSGYSTLIPDWTWRDLPGLTTTVTTTGAPTPVRASALIQANSYGAVVRFLIDGVPADGLTNSVPGAPRPDWGYDLPATGAWGTTQLEEWVTVPAGTHTITAQYLAFGGTTIWGASSLDVASFPGMAGADPAVQLAEAHATPAGYSTLTPDFGPWRDIPGLTVSLTAADADAPARLSALIQSNQPNGQTAVRFVIDGVAADAVTDSQPGGNGAGWGYDVQATNAWGTTQLEEWVRLAAGTHTVKVQYRAFGATPTIWSASNLNAAVFPNRPVPLFADSNRTVVTPAQTLAGLTVSREVTVPAAGAQDFARTVDVFTNPTAAPVTTTVTVVGNLGSDAATTVFATQSGNTAVEPGDQWVGTDDADGTGSPAVIHYVHGPVGLVPDSVAVVGDNVVWTYTLTVPAGETVRLASFTILADTRAAAISAAGVLVGGTGFGGEAAAFLTAGELDSLANFQFNHPPVADPQAVTTDEDAAAAVTLTGSDPDGNPLTYTVVTGPAHGTLGGTAPNLTYTPAPDYHGPDSFTFTVNDGRLDSPPATVSVTVNSIDDTPVARPDAAATDEDTALTVPAAVGLLTNDSDADRDALTVASVNGVAADVGRTVTLASGARLTVAADGGYVYDPRGALDRLAAGEPLTDGFDYEVSDGGGATGVAHVTITVTGVNDAPAVSGPAAVSVAENTPAGTTIALYSVTDPDSLVAVTLGGPDAAAFDVTPVGPGSYAVRFRAAPDYETGPHAYHVTVTASDGARTATQDLTVAVTNVNDNAPAAAPDALVVAEDGAAPAAVLANDTDPDGDPLTVEAVGFAAHGTLTYAGPVITYTPGPDFFGTDSFTYTVSDGVHTATAAVSVTVTEVNDAPAAAADSYRVTQTGTVAFAGLLANDTDPDNADGLPGNEDTLAVGEVNGVALAGGPLTAATAHGGTVVVAADGSFAYTPAPAFSGVDSFTYRARDSRGALSPTAATVSLTVSSVTWAYDAGTNTLAVTGRSPDETITLSRDPATGRVRLGGTLDEVTDAPAAPGLTITVDAGAGGDAVNLSALAAPDYAASTLRGDPGDTLTGGGRPDAFVVTVGATAGPAAAVAGGAGDTLTVVGTAAADAFDVNLTAAGAAVGNGTVVTFGGLAALTLDGLDGADSYAVGADGLGVAVAVADGGTTGADAATVYGTAGPDAFDVNGAAVNAVLLGGTPRVSYTPALESLTVAGLAGDDTFTVTPSRYAAGQATAIVVQGDGPATEPGDTLVLRASGVAEPTLEGAGGGPDLLPGGRLRSAAASPTHAPVEWSGIETLPVPGGLGGSFDFGPAGSQVQPGFTPVGPEAAYTPAGGYGWATTPPYGNRAYDEGAGAFAGSPLLALLRDYAFGWNGADGAGVFRVAVAPNRPVQVTAYLGAPGVQRDGQVVEWSPDGASWVLLTPAAGVTTLPGEFVSAGGVVTPAGGDLYVRFRDVTGEPYWSAAGLDVRPTDPATATGTGALVAPLPVSRAYSTDGAAPGGAAVPADGLSIDYYHGSGAVPNSLLTITATNGTVVDAAETAGDHALGTRFLNPDAAGYVRGFQAQADAAGGFTFGVRRPTGAAASTVRVADATGFRAGAVTQAFALPTTRRIDFGPLPAAGTADYGNGGTVGVGYTPFAAATYTAAAALGWAPGTPPPQAFTPGGAGATAVQADGVFGGYAPSEFVLDVPAGTYVVTATLGDLAARRDDLFVEVFDGTGWVFAKAFNPATGNYDLDLAGLTAPAGVSPNAGQSMARSFLAGAAGGQLWVRFGNVTGNPNWSLSALDVRPAPAALAVARTSAAPTADGTTVSTYEVTGAAAGTVLTVRAALGAPAGTDASTTYDGFQVVVPPSGTATFAVTAPYSTTAAGSIIEVESVSGGERGTLAEGYAASPPPPTTTPAVRRFDFNGPSNDTNPGMTGVRGNQVWTAGADYGWLSAVSEFERATTSLPASMTAAQKALFRDGASLGGPAGTFRVKVSDAGADYAVRYYVGDSAKKWPWIRLQVEGGATSGQLATNVNQYWSYVMFGKDLNGDGYLDVSVFGSATWVLNAIDVAKGTTAAALPPSLFAPSPQAAAFTVTSGTAPKLTAAALAPVVAAAVTRWAAAGADPARLASVTVSIADLNDAGRLGEHVPGSVHIDDDAGGRGWFVDPTPADDAEFGSAVSLGRGATDGPAARGVDLLTVVMHELGHELGLADADPAAAPGDLMAETLDVGVRRLPAVGGDLPVRPTVTVTTPAARPALWLDKAETVYSSGTPAAPTDDRVRVRAAAAEPVKAGAARVAVAPPRAATPAWPDADALLDLDGVYVG